MENKDKLNAKARRLKALADSGVGGEKTNAEKMYREFIEKHGLDDSNMVSSVRQRKLKVKNDDDALILVNIILSVNPFTKVLSDRQIVSCELDLEDYNEVRQKFSYFIKLYIIEKELLNMAFFSKHREFFQPDEYVAKKWREHNKENDELRKAREKSEKITEKAKSDKLTEEQLKRLNKEMQIQTMNMSRMVQLSEILIDADYTRNSKTLSDGNKK